MAKRNIFVNFTYNGEDLRGQVDFQQSTRKGDKVFFRVAVGTTPVVNMDIVTGMNWDYTFTNSYSVKRRGAFYVPASAVHTFNAGGKNECRVVEGAMYEHALHLNTIGNGKLSAEPIE
jgi:hypothetical protein